MVAAAIRTIFAQPDATHVHDQPDVIAGMLGRQFTKVDTMLRDAGPELLAFAAFSATYRRAVYLHVQRHASSGSVSSAGDRRGETGCDHRDGENTLNFFLRVQRGECGAGVSHHLVPSPAEAAPCQGYDFDLRWALG